MNRNSLILAPVLVAALGISTTGLAAAPPADADVGDASSFGSKVVWIGLLTTGVVNFATDCTSINPTLGPDDRCVTLNGFTPTNFAFADLGRVTLPANSVTTLLCQWATPSGNYILSNPAATVATAHFSVRPTYRIESKVLDGPTFNGGIDLAVSGLLDEQSLAPGAQQIHSISTSRVCIGGLISTSALINQYGLTARQAASFFQGPITIRAGLTGQAFGVDGGFVTYGTRLIADHP